MKNKKGFTLIEVLAVIIILAIILVIIAPKVNEYYKDSVKRKNLQSAYGVRNALNQYYASYTGTFRGYTCEFPDNCSEIKLDGTVPTYGIVSITADGIISGFVRYDNNVFTLDDEGVTASEYTTVPGDFFDFSYSTSGEQTFLVTDSGYYKLEVWGAQGASVSSYRGGYGGYSSGIIYLNSNTDLYINIGGMGVAQTSSVSTGTSYAGGYNGGGHGYNRGTTNALRTGGGGGASHIATVSGTLSSLSEYKNTGGENISDEILIVAGGGASAYGYGSKWWNGNSGGGMTGGYSSDQSYAATQTTGYQFGQAGSSFGTDANYAGAGGGWYGGVSAWGEVGAGGGSGYIRNPELTSGVMYCYGCTENSNAGTRTINSNGSNKDAACPNGYSSDPLSNCAKSENGYARITYVGNSL